MPKFAAKLLEVGPLPARFDAFGNHFQVKMMSEGDDEPRDFPAFNILLETAKEGTIDLQNVDGKTAEAAERGMARAKIVYAEPDAEILQLREDARRSFGVTHGYGFCDFQLQAPGRHFRFLQSGFDVGDEIALRELAGRNIYRDRQLRNRC